MNEGFSGLKSPMPPNNIEFVLVIFNLNYLKIKETWKGNGWYGIRKCVMNIRKDRANEKDLKIILKGIFKFKEDFDIDNLITVSMSRLYEIMHLYPNPHMVLISRIGVYNKKFLGVDVEAEFKNYITNQKRSIEFRRQCIDEKLTSITDMIN